MPHIGADGQIGVPDHAVSLGDAGEAAEGQFFYGTTPNGSYTLIMGFLCGFPMGARIAIAQKQENHVNADCHIEKADKVYPDIV